MVTVPAIEKQHRPTFCENVFHGAYNGMKIGAGLGGTIVITTIATGFFQNPDNKQLVDCEHNWPMVVGDNSQYSDGAVPSIPYVSFFVISTTTLGGLLVGAVAGAAKSVFVG